MFLTEEEIQAIGFRYVGYNVKISKDARFFNPQNISIGYNVRIDAFSILSAGEIGIMIGNFVHVAAHASLIGDIILEDYVGISHKCTLLSSSDDFTGEYFSNPMCDLDKRNVTHGTIVIEKLCVIGVGSVIFPNVTIGENSCVGAMSLVNRNLDEHGMYAGIPVHFIKERKENKFV